MGMGMERGFGEMWKGEVSGFQLWRKARAKCAEYCFQEERARRRNRAIWARGRSMTCRLEEEELEIPN